MLTDLGRSAQWAFKDAIETRHKSWEFHWRVFQAISDGNRPAAEKAMAEHIQDVWSRLETNEE
jgi:DNA-binding GntR family transcriptional regulator